MTSQTVVYDYRLVIILEGEYRKLDLLYHLFIKDKGEYSNDYS